MSDLADSVPPDDPDTCRTLAPGKQPTPRQAMHEAVDILEAAIPTTDPAEVYAVIHKALASAIKVIARADDSIGIIGHACRRLLDLHPEAAAAAHVPTGKLIDWMMKFQLDGDVDYFELDPVAYAPALGEKGMKPYRARLDEIETGLGRVSHTDETELAQYTHVAGIVTVRPTGSERSRGRDRAQPPVMPTFARRQAAQDAVHDLCVHGVVAARCDYRAPGADSLGRQVGGVGEEQVRGRGAAGAGVVPVRHNANRIAASAPAARAQRSGCVRGLASSASEVGEGDASRRGGGRKGAGDDDRPGAGLRTAVQDRADELAGQ